MNAQWIAGVTQENRALPLGITLLLAVAPLGCSASQPTSADRAAILPSLVPAGEIGCSDCGDARQVTPTAVALLDDRRVAVLDSWEPFVRIFDAVGNPTNTFGELGQGPGEMGMNAGMPRPIPGTWILPYDGGVAIIDIDTKLETFDATGRFIAQHPLALPIVPVDQAFDAATATYFRAGFDAAAEGRGPGITGCRLGEPSGAVCGPLPRFESFLSDAADPRPPNTLFRTLAIGATLDGGLVVADRGTYRIWVFDPQGAVVVETGRDISRIAKSDEEIQEERDRWRGPADALDIDPLREHIERGGLGVDGSGRIWVLTQRWAETESVFDVFAESGEYLGEVAVAAQVRQGQWTVAPFFLRGDRLAAVVSLEDGSERVRLWDLH